MKQELIKVIIEGLCRGLGQILIEVGETITKNYQEKECKNDTSLSQGQQHNFGTTTAGKPTVFAENISRQE
jgi:hypothetical protein